MSAARRSVGQFIKFAIIGLASNVAGYVIYLLLTWMGVGPKLAMTILFVIGTLQTFVFNKNWTFAYRQHPRGSFARYAIAYFSAYCFNLLILFALVDHIHWPHEGVQAVTIVVLAIYLFGLQKFWVFRRPDQHIQPGRE